MTGPIAKEDLKTLGIEEPDGYGPIPMEGYEYHTVMWLEGKYQLSFYHNEKNVFRPDELVGVLDRKPPQVGRVW